MRLLLLLAVVSVCCICCNAQQQDLFAELAEPDETFYADEDIQADVFPGLELGPLLGPFPQDVDNANAHISALESRETTSIRVMHDVITSRDVISSRDVITKKTLEQLEHEQTDMQEEEREMKEIREEARREEVEALQEAANQEAANQEAASTPEQHSEVVEDHDVTETLPTHDDVISRACAEETPKQCHQKKVDKFISVWLTYEGIPGMIFLIGNNVSLVSLALTFITFLAFKQLNSSIRGVATINFAGAMFMAQLSFQINPHFAAYATACAVLAMLQHLFCFVAFLWLNVIAYDVMMEMWDVKNGHGVVDQTSNGVMLSADLPKNIFRQNISVYAAFSWGGPAALIILCAVLQVELGGEFKYGSKYQCGIFGDEALLYSLAFPITLISIINMTFFVLTVRWMPTPLLLCRRPSQILTTDPVNDTLKVLNATTTESSTDVEYSPATKPKSCLQPKPVEYSPDSKPKSVSFQNTLLLSTPIKTAEIKVDVAGCTEKSQLPTEGPAITAGNPTEMVGVPVSSRLGHRHIWNYVRISVVVSLAWLSGFLAVFTQNYWLWIIFVGVNSLQGMLVFGSLVMTGRIMSLCMDKFRLTRLPAMCRSVKRSATGGEGGGFYQANLAVISDGYVLLDENTDIVYIQ